MVNIKKIFGQNLRKYRKLKGFSQEKLAELIGLGQKSISPIENGSSFISTEKLEKLCVILEVEPFQLFISNQQFGEISDEMQRERVFTRLKACKKEELELVCDILSRFMEK